MSAPEYPKPPPQSRAVLEPIDGGIRIALPPRGMFKPKAPENMSVLPLFLSVGITYGAVAETLRSGFAWPWLFGIVFWIFGGAFLLIGIQEGRSRARLRATRDGLSVEVRGPLKDRLYVWRREEISDVRRNANRWTRRKHLAYGLLVAHVKGPNRLLFVARDGEELEWLAGVLRQALNQR